MSNCFDNGYSLRETLRHNLGKVCSIVTDSGGEFTGVLSETNSTSCKLIRLNNTGRAGCDCCDGARRIQTIPIDKICCLETSQF